MQQLPVHAQLGTSAVLGITRNRVTEVCGVHAYLMRAAREYVETHEVVARQPFLDGVFGHGRSAVRHDRHALAVAGVAPDGSVHSARVLFQMPHNQPEIYLGHRAVGYLRGQRKVRLVVLGDHHDARGVLVQPVDYARAQRAVYGGQ